MSLTTVRPGKDRIVHAVQGEGDTRHHLEGLGFVPGARLKVVSRLGSSVIVNVKGSRVALDKRLAECVLV